MDGAIQGGEGGRGGKKINGEGKDGGPAAFHVLALVLQGKSAGGNWRASRNLFLGWVKDGGLSEEKKGLVWRLVMMLK